MPPVPPCLLTSLPHGPVFVSRERQPLLPGQTMTLHVFEPRYIRLTERALSEPRLQGSFGMVASSARNSGLATHGVEAKILEHSDAGGGRYFLRVQGRRRFRILRTWGLDGYRNAAISWASDRPANLDAPASSMPASSSGTHDELAHGARNSPDARTQGSDDSHTSVDAARSGARGESGDDDEVEALAHGMLLATELRAVLASWLSEVRVGWERRPGQVDRCLTDLGPMPESDALEAFGLWAAACINPLPPLGVAPEVRLAALEATEPLARLRLVLAATESSLHHLRRHSTRHALNRFTNRLTNVLLYPAAHPWQTMALLVGVVAIVFARAASDAYETVPTPSRSATPRARAHAPAQGSRTRMGLWLPFPFSTYEDHLAVEQALEWAIGSWWTPAAPLLGTALRFVNNFGFL